MKRTSVITGDVINSRHYASKSWLPYLKEALNYYGKEPEQWEIYRGDSFQLELPPEKALEAALFIKATLRQVKGMDVRLAIGIGEKDSDSPAITEANGSAFVNSGQCFENLHKNTLALRSPWNDFDKEMNLQLSLAQLTIDRWGSNASRIIQTAMKHPGYTQKELAKKLNKTQSTVSESLARAGYEEIMSMEKHYRESIKNK